MDTDLLSKYSALRRELAVAYQQLPWQGSRIDQIAADLAETERALSARHGQLPPPEWRAAAGRSAGAA